MTNTEPAENYLLVKTGDPGEIMFKYEAWRTIPEADKLNCCHGHIGIRGRRV